MNLFPYHNYYSYKDNIFSTKLNATISARSDLENHDADCNYNIIKWHLPNFEQEMEKIDCSVEPEESLSTLYRKRAEQLRNQYPYLILFYSGGNDSHNILETFMLNGIFLDEIVILNWYDTATKKQWEQENPSFIFSLSERFESEYAALPLAKYFVETFSPKTKITYIENVFQKNKKFFESLNKNTYEADLKSHIEVLFDYRNALRIRNTYLLDERFDKLHSAHIYGICKPTVSRDEIGYYLQYQDNTINGRCDPYFQKNANFTNELFYIHPSTCKMQIKQAHTLINNNATDFHIKRTRYGEDLMSKVLYNRKVQMPYSGLKYLDLLEKQKFKDLMDKIDEKTNLHSFEFTVIQQLHRDKISTAIQNINRLKKTIHEEFFINNICLSSMSKWLVKTAVTKKFYLKWN